ncbi:zinc finger, matrin-type 5 S homeolog [Xenopus laevis]|uniref:Zinc finger matrin-type protein 5 n=1 Tax=Xenopus laevis TaxID=8355 RepID=A0A8J0QFS6_XENLA|nr:zinc finger, matrin-type 5 S homeolog [Xenopus laevis]
MGRRYFCDYCDRSFQDNLHNRKKHLNGVQHQRSKKVWFDTFRGQCDFGPGCRFSHLTVEELEALKGQVEAERWAREMHRRQLPPCNIERWLEERAKKRACSKNDSISQPPTYQLPPSWPPLCELPPSLRPPSEWDEPPGLEWG